jgi:hypothetical protein
MAKGYHFIWMWFLGLGIFFLTPSTGYRYHHFKTFKNKNPMAENLNKQGSGSNLGKGGNSGNQSGNQNKGNQSNDRNRSDEDLKKTSGKGSSKEGREEEDLDLNSEDSREDLGGSDKRNFDKNKGNINKDR